MQRIVQLDQRVQIVRTAGHGVGLLLGFEGRQDFALEVGELVVLTRDFQNVGMLGRRPERAKPFRLQPRKRVIGAKVRKSGIQLVRLSIDRRFDDLVRIAFCRVRHGACGVEFGLWWYRQCSVRHVFLPVGAVIAAPF